MAGKNVTIGNVNIAMSVNAAKMIAQAQKAEQSFTKTMKRMLKGVTKFNKSVASAGKGLLKFSGVAAGVGGAAVFLGKQVYDAQREMQRMADVAGVSMETFSKMSHVTKSLGLETEYMSDAMKDLNVRIADAAKGGGTMVDFFALMGESASDWVDLKPEQQLDKFLGTLDKLGDNDAKFWADEVNDSMYRLAVTLNRSGKSVQDFMAEANEFGAGTSAVFIGQINEMYESFNRLRTMVMEIVQSVAGVLAPAFTAAFDKMSGSLKGLLSDGDTTSEGIFNLSKNIALTILSTLNDMYIGIQAFFTKTSLLLSKLDSSFAVGLLSTKQMDQLAQVDDRIASLQSALGNNKSFSSLDFTSWFGPMDDKEAAALEEKLQAAVALRNRILADAENDPAVQAFTQLIKDVKGQSFSDLSSKPASKPKPTAEKSNVPNGTQDPAVLREALTVMQEMQSVAGQQTDSTLKQIELDKEKLQGLIDHYNLLRKQGMDTQAMLINEAQATNALDELEDKRLARLKEIHQERIDEQAREYNEKLNLHKQHLSARQAFDEEYRNTYGAMTQAQQELEKIQLGEYLQQNLITHQEYAQALVKLQDKKAQSEIASELNKMTVVANGMQAFFGESQALARAGFAFTQGIALSEVIMNQARAVSAAWADPTLPFYGKIGASVMAAAQVGQQIQAVKSAAVGQFHNGGQIPYDGTYYMEGGEMVIPKDTVRDFVDNTKTMGAGEGGEGISINSTINMGASLVDRKAMTAALQEQQTTIAALVRKEQKKRPTR